MKILVNAPFSKENRELIKKAAGDNKVVFYDTDNCGGYEDVNIVIGELPEAFPQDNLRFLQLTNAGVEKYCIDGRVADGVIVANVTGAFGEVISEYIVGAILAMYRSFFGYHENRKQHIWQDLKQERLIYGSNVLILGCGDIGSSTALKLKQFGARITGIRRNVKSTAGFDAVFGIEQLDSLLPQADIVIGCLPHTDKTAGLLDRKRLNLMKTGAMLVNVGRGTLVDANALIELLNNGKLYGAVLDVFDTEPLPKNSPLWDMPNVMITPHISGPSFNHSPYTEQVIARICADNLCSFLSGKPIINIIDRNVGYAEKRD